MFCSNRNTQSGLKYADVLSWGKIQPGFKSSQSSVFYGNIQPGLKHANFLANTQSGLKHAGVLSLMETLGLAPDHANSLVYKKNMDSGSQSCQYPLT
jgi:hypothetical protein